MWAGRYQPTADNSGDPEQKQTAPPPNLDLESRSF
jgi:hypothetical protein